MMLNRTVLACLIATFFTAVPALAQNKDCTKVDEKDQAECYYDQADSLAEETIETLTEKCGKIENKEVDKAFCTAFGMAVFLEEAKKWTPKKR